MPDKTPISVPPQQGVGRSALVLLARRLKNITGIDPNVTIKEARTMCPVKLEDELRSFGIWYRNHAESTAQGVEGAIWSALDDEENNQTLPTGGAALRP